MIVLLAGMPTTVIPKTRLGDEAEASAEKKSYFFLGNTIGEKITPGGFGDNEPFASYTVL